MKSLFKRSSDSKSRSSEGSSRSRSKESNAGSKEGNGSKGINYTLASIMEFMFYYINYNYSPKEIALNLYLRSTTLSVQLLPRSLNGYMRLLVGF